MSNEQVPGKPELDRFDLHFTDGKVMRKHAPAEPWITPESLAAVRRA